MSDSIQKLKARTSLFLQVTQYLLDKALIIDEDTLYELSLKIEPRLPAWRFGLAPESVEFSWKAGWTELCMSCLPRCSENSGEGDKARSPLSMEKDGTNWNSVSSQGNSAVWGSKTGASDVGGKVKRMVFGKADDGTFCIRECKMGDVVAILMKQGRSISDSTPCSKLGDEDSWKRPVVFPWHFIGPGIPSSLLLGFNCFRYIYFVTSFQQSRGFLLRDVPTHKQFQSRACAWFSVHGEVMACSETAFSVFRQQDKKDIMKVKWICTWDFFN